MGTCKVRALTFSKSKRNSVSNVLEKDIDAIRRICFHEPMASAVDPSILNLFNNLLVHRMHRQAGRVVLAVARLVHQYFHGGCTSLHGIYIIRKFLGQAFGVLLLECSPITCLNIGEGTPWNCEQKWGVIAREILK